MSCSTRNRSIFAVIAGLGARGWVLVGGRAVSDVDIHDSLGSSDKVESFVRNTSIEGQASPNDPEFETRLLGGLEAIDAPMAWNTTQGNSHTVGGCD